MANIFEDKGYFRRKFPRRAFGRKLGILAKGSFFLGDSGEIGEGGLSFSSDFVLSKDCDLVISFQIPGGSFVSLRGQVKTLRQSNGRMDYGIAFAEIPFLHRREIRVFVSAREQTLTSDFR